MKKSLKVIASAATAFSMFASVAMADDAATTGTTTSTTTTTTTATTTKTSADFKDLANVDAALKAKIDALLKAGVFEGTAADSFGINENMNRAQMAKILILIYNVKVDDTVKSSSFADVKADDTANGWAIPYIEAAKKAGLIDGMTDTTFAPGDKVTLGQFATALVKGLGKKVDVTGAPWYKDAVAQAISLKVLPDGTDGSKLATRSDLVVGAFGGQQAYSDINKPAQVSVASVKATGVKTVVVNFDRDVDTAKATLSLKRGTIAVNTTAKFADDKKSATLTLSDTKLMAGDYTVTLGGLDAATIKTATGTFTAQDEQVQKIEFVTSSDTIAKATSVLVKIKATNQYGELASVPSGSYNFYGDISKLSKNADGYLIATINSSAATSGVGIVTATITNNDSHVTATKNFTVGTIPILSKVDLGTAQYSNGTAINGTGDNAKFSLNFYDQYGSMINYDTINANNWTPTVIWNDFLDGANGTTEDDGNGNPILKISLTKNIDKSGDYNFTLIDQAASTTGKVSIKSAKVATKIQIGSLNDVIAAGDNDSYIPVVAFDAQGNQLSIEDLTSTENLNRITINSSATVGGTGFPAAGTNKLESSGEHKGQIKLTGLPSTKNSSVSISAFIATSNVTSNDSKNFTVQQARIPDHFLEATIPGKQLTPGGSSAFKYQVIDQYGKVLNTLKQVDSQGNVSGSGSHYKVTVIARTYSDVNANNMVTTSASVGSLTYLNNPILSSVTGSTYALVTGDSDAVAGYPAGLPLPANGNGYGSYAAIDSTGLTLTSNLKPALNDKTYRFAALNDVNAKGYRVDLIATIWKDKDGDNNYSEVSKLTRTVTVADVATSDLTYTLNSIPALWYAKDSGVVTDRKYDDAPYGVTSYMYKDDMLLNVSNITTKSKFAQEVKISAKNAAGETVGLPKQITSISSSDTNVVNTYLFSDTTGVLKGYVIGNKVGTAKVAVSFVAADGTTQTMYGDITVKNDALNVATITWDDNAYLDTYSFNAFQKLNVTDNYGVKYEDTDAQKYNPFLGVTFAVKLTGASKTNGDTVSVDNYGNVRANPRVGGTTVTFDLTANSATGKSATASIEANSSNTNYTAK